MVKLRIVSSENEVSIPVETEGTRGSGGALSPMFSRDETSEPNNFLSCGSERIIYTDMLFMVHAHISYMVKYTAMTIILVFIC